MILCTIRRYERKKTFKEVTMKGLITGFDPFGADTINPSYEIVKALPDTIEGCQIIKKEIPTIFNKSIEELQKVMEVEKPDFVICIGQAGGEYGMRVERVAINLNEARIPDNIGQQPQDETIYADGEKAYFATLPNKAIVKEMHEANIPANLSYSAGTFVCNHLLYGLMYTIEKKYPMTRGGFIHVPFLPEQVIDKKNTAFMTLDMMIKATILAIKATINYQVDIQAQGGALH